MALYCQKVREISTRKQILDCVLLTNFDNFESFYSAILQMGIQTKRCADTRMHRHSQLARNMDVIAFIQRNIQQPQAIDSTSKTQQKKQAFGESAGALFAQ